MVIDNNELDVASNTVYSCSHGELRPNIILVGYKSDWLNCPRQDLETFLNILKYVYFFIFYIDTVEIKNINIILHFSVAKMNGMVTIIIRVSSTERFEKQNVLIEDFKHLYTQENIPYKPVSNQNAQNIQK